MADWVEEEFQAADLGDKRLLTRMKKILSQLSNAPVQSIASALKGWAEVNAAYRFINNPKTSIEKVLAPHAQAIKKRAEQHPRVLIVQDTTELDYTRKRR